MHFIIHAPFLEYRIEDFGNDPEFSFFAVHGSFYSFYYQDL